jgi:hypothetical protein
MSDARLDEVATLATKLTDELLADSRAALDAELYEVAYHALAAALHGAEAARDDGRLREIQAEATRQQNMVDARSPSHRLSRNSGRERRHGGWFDALAVQATSVMSRHHATAALEQSTAQRLEERARQRDEIAPKL